MWHIITNLVDEHAERPHVDVLVVPDTVRREGAVTRVVTRTVTTVTTGYVVSSYMVKELIGRH